LGSADQEFGRKGEDRKWNKPHFLAADSDSFHAEAHDLRMECVLYSVGNQQLMALDHSQPSATKPAWQRLARFFLPEDSPEGGWGTDELGLVWRHQLAAPLRLELAGTNAGQEDSAQVQDESKAGIRTFGELFRHPHPPIDLLIMVKEFAKRHLDYSQSPLPREIANGLYYATLATALVRLAQRITGLDDLNLCNGLTWCVNQSWLDEETRELFGEALRKRTVIGLSK
jgi:hypothetical protein